MSDERTFLGDLGVPPTAPAAAEELLTGGRLLRRAFLETPLVNLGPGAEIIRPGERDAPVFLICRGYVLRSSQLLDGRQAIVDVLVPGDIGGLDHIVLSRPLGEFVAANKLGVTFYRLLPFRSLMQQHASAALRVLALSAEARWRCDRVATAVKRLDARGRIAAFILETYQRLRRRGLINTLSFNLPLTQRQLGDYLGLTIVHVNRTLRRLRGERLVHIDRQVVIIMNYERLRSLVHGLPDAGYLPNPMMPETICGVVRSPAGGQSDVG